LPDLWGCCYLFKLRRFVHSPPLESLSPPLSNFPPLLTREFRALCSARSSCLARKTALPGRWSPPPLLAPIRKHFTSAPAASLSGGPASHSSCCARSTRLFKKSPPFRGTSFFPPLVPQTYWIPLVRTMRTGSPPAQRRPSFFFPAGPTLLAKRTLQHGRASL